MDISVNVNGTALTLSPAGRLDTATAPQLQAVVNGNIAGVTDLTFDLKKLDYLASAGLRVLMSAQKVMNKQGKMKLINANDDVTDIFDMTGLADVFTIE
ncbi:MAG: STAS domain-containing protein [Clostridia bacterium]|nr:STAS domain-containing protein [Clostridia bacterium]